MGDKPLEAKGAEAPDLLTDIILDRPGSDKS